MPPLRHLAAGSHGSHRPCRGRRQLREWPATCSALSHFAARRDRRRSSREVLLSSLGFHRTWRAEHITALTQHGRVAMEMVGKDHMQPFDRHPPRREIPAPIRPGRSPATGLGKTARRVRCADAAYCVELGHVRRDWILGNPIWNGRRSVTTPSCATSPFKVDTNKWGRREMEIEFA